MYDAAVRIAPKSEFETTAEYGARRRKALSGGSYAFVVRSDPDVDVKYDADTELMTVNVEPITAKVDLGASEKIVGYVVNRAVKSVSERPATNAFGATTLVERTVQDLDVAALPRVGPLSAGVTMTFRIPRLEAQKLKPRLRILIIGSVASDQVPLIDADGERSHNGFSVLEATFDSPSEYVTNYFFLKFDVSDIWNFRSCYRTDSWQVF